MIFFRIFANFVNSYQNPDTNKGKFLSEGADVFIIPPKRRTSYFSEFENLQGSKLSKLKTSSISKQFSDTKIQIFKFRKIKCLFV